jgi:vacuolar-type H+-ATPase subunit I/STV1
MPKEPMDRRYVDLDEDDREVFEMERLGVSEPEEGKITEEQPETKVTEIWVYAKSEEEARENAKTVIDLIGKLAYAGMEELKGDLRLNRERIEKFESEIPELEKKYKEIEKEIEEHKKTVHYRYKEDAERSILHWMDLLNAIEVDLVGIKARLSKIKELKENGYGSSLRLMQASAEVDLAGALARKKAAQTFRQKAVDFVALSREQYILSKDIPAKQGELKQIKNKVLFIEKKLSNLVAANIQPVEVVGNEVTIHPVK